MADSFDIVDIIFAATESANSGLIGYKDRSVTGEIRNHYTVRTLGLETKEVVNKAPVVNINVFIKTVDKNDMMNRHEMKIACRAIEKSLKENIIVPEGMYFKTRIVWSEPLGKAKEGFDCTNIRLEVITQLN